MKMEAIKNLKKDIGICAVLFLAIMIVFFWLLGCVGIIYDLFKW